MHISIFFLNLTKNKTIPDSKRIVGDWICGTSSDICRYISGKKLLIVLKLFRLVLFPVPGKNNI